MRLSDLPGDINEISGDVLDAGVEVQRHLGRRLAERTYRLVLAHELRLRGHVANEEYPLPFVYKDLVVPGAYGVDILVDDKIVVELKCVEALERKHEAQVFGYLRAPGCRLGSLLNFHAPRVVHEFRRLIL